jgi:hypothetical protein
VDRSHFVSEKLQKPFLTDDGSFRHGLALMEVVMQLTSELVARVSHPVADHDPSPISEPMADEDYETLAIVAARISAIHTVPDNAAHDHG